MGKIAPNFVYDDDGNKVGIMLTNKKFEKMVEKLEDYYDYKIVKKRARRIGKTYTAEEVWAELEARKE